MANVVVGPFARRGRIPEASDVYMERTQADADPVIRRALEQMVRAARQAVEARGQLNDARRALERHPDYIKAEAARRRSSEVGSLTLAYWVHGCILGALHDAELDEVGDWLLVDADPRRARASLGRFIADDQRDRALFARRPARKAVPNVTAQA